MGVNIHTMALWSQRENFQDLLSTSLQDPGTEFRSSDLNCKRFFRRSHFACSRCRFQILPFLTLIIIRRYLMIPGVTLECCLPSVPWNGSQTNNTHTFDPLPENPPIKVHVTLKMGNSEQQSVCQQASHFPPLPPTDSMWLDGIRWTHLSSYSLFSANISVCRKTHQPLKSSSLRL